VATILGLLLVVTFLANYLATTLPNTMGANDLQHEQQVENQVAQFSALLTAVAQAGVVGAQVSQPINLGSAAAAPFAASDGAFLSAANVSTGMSLNFTLNGPVIYTPPTGGTPAGSPVTGCSYSTSSPQISCPSSAGAYNLYYNFTGTAKGTQPYLVSLAGTTYQAHLNLTVNSSAINLTTGAGTMSILAFGVIGNLDTIGIPLSTGTEAILVFGSNDTLTLSGTGAAGRTAVYVVGNNDTVSLAATAGAGSTHTFVASFYGTQDHFKPSATVSGNTNSFTVFFTGANPATPRSMCPVDNRAGADSVTQPTVTGSGNTFSLTYNNTTGSTGTSTVGKWTFHTVLPTLFNCPFNAPLLLPLTNPGTPIGAGFDVHLLNDYAPGADIAFDQGAGVFWEQGGAPIFFVPPPITYANGVLTITQLRFSTQLGSEGGTGTADLVAQLLSVNSFSIPGSGLSLLNGSAATVTIVTPFASAWYGYFLNYTALSPYVTCTGSNHVCFVQNAYRKAGSLGTIVLSIPGTGLTLQAVSAVFSIKLQ